jgi:hypothetical protein
MRLFPVATVLTQDQLFHLCTMDQIHVSHQEVHIVRVHVIGEVIALGDMHDLLLAEWTLARAVRTLTFITNDLDFILNGIETCEESAIDILAILIGSTRSTSNGPPRNASAHHFDLFWYVGFQEFQSSVKLVFRAVVCAL